MGGLTEIGIRHQRLRVQEDGGGGRGGGVGFLHTSYLT